MLVSVTQNFNARPSKLIVSVPICLILWQEVRRRVEIFFTTILFCLLQIRNDMAS